LFIGQSDGLPRAFKKCKKTAFFEGSKKTFFVMTQVGPFSASVQRPPVLHNHNQAEAT
jgi:hypothetical protein